MRQSEGARRLKKAQMKKCAIVLASLCFLGFHLYSSLAYNAIEDSQQRIKKLEKDIASEEQALLQLKNRYEAILKKKERLMRYLARRKEAIQQILRALEEKQRLLQEQRQTKAKLSRERLQKKRQAIINENLIGLMKQDN